MSFYEERAQALYESAKAHHAIDRVKEDMDLFKNGVGGEKMFVQMVTRDNVSNISKAELLRDIMTYFHDDTKQFFNYFIADAQYQYIFRSIQCFEQLYAKHHIDIISAVPLTEQQVERIRIGAAKKAKNEFDTLTCVVDSSIIAGVIVKSKDFVFDTSFTTQLKEFKKSFE